MGARPQHSQLLRTIRTFLANVVRIVICSNNGLALGTTAIVMSRTGHVRGHARLAGGVVIILAPLDVRPTKHAIILAAIHAIDSLASDVATPIEIGGSFASVVAHLELEGSLGT